MTDQTPTKSPDPAQVLNGLKDDLMTLQLATLESDGSPQASYTPFATDGAGFLIFVSELARHTRNLAADPRCSVLLVADEVDSPNLFARTRAGFRCRAQWVQRESPEYEGLLDRFQERQGKTVQLLRQLGDFRLYRLAPESGHLVLGFGKAFRISGAELDHFEHTDRA